MTNWQDLILEYQKSGSSVKDFCKHHSINYYTFRYHLKKQSSSCDGFISIKPPQMHLPFEIIYPNGVRILVNQNLSSEQLKALIYV